MSCRLCLAAKVRRNWIGHVPLNSLSIHLPNGMLHGNDIAVRGFRGMAGRVLIEFCLVDPEQEFALTFLNVRLLPSRVVLQLAYLIIRRDFGQSSLGRSPGITLVNRKRDSKPRGERG